MGSLRANGLIVRRAVCLASVASILVGFTAADEEKARQGAHQLKAIYWQCLADVTQRQLTRAMSTEDFSIFIKGVCLAEEQNFRVAVVDYLAMKFPEISTGTHLAEADRLVSLAQADVVSTYIDLKSKPTQ